jgi:catechol 2,3-dioxygenase-like lactoylglutathione lyase family enzyme
VVAGYLGSVRVSVPGVSQRLPSSLSTVRSIMRVSLDHIHIFSTNLSVTVGFFQKMFDATLVWDEDAAGVRTVRLRLGNAFVQVYEQAPKAQRGGAMHHLGIETDDLDELVARMKANGHEFRNAIQEQPKFRYVMTAGPDDLLIELFQCHEPQRWQLKP